jgi:hypothetical protein
MWHVGRHKFAAKGCNNVCWLWRPIWCLHILYMLFCMLLTYGTEISCYPAIPRVNAKSAVCIYCLLVATYCCSFLQLKFLIYILVTIVNVAPYCCLYLQLKFWGVVVSNSWIYSSPLDLSLGSGLLILHLYACLPCRPYDFLCWSSDWFRPTDRVELELVNGPKPFI